MVEVVRQLQLPVLALILLSGCAAKLVRAVRSGSLSTGLGPTELFPLPLRWPWPLLAVALPPPLRRKRRPNSPWP